MPLPPDLNKPAFRLFPELADRIMCGKCVICDNDIRHSDFKDDISKKEYGISGLCQNCQNEVFGSEPNWDDIEEMFAE